jgi:Flagellar hook-length control protein FliK
VIGLENLAKHIFPSGFANTISRTKTDEPAAGDAKVFERLAKKEDIKAGKAETEIEGLVSGDELRSDADLHPEGYQQTLLGNAFTLLIEPQKPTGNVESTHNAIGQLYLDPAIKPLVKSNFGFALDGKNDGQKMAALQPKFWAKTREFLDPVRTKSGDEMKPDLTLAGSFKPNLESGNLTNFPTQQTPNFLPAMQASFSQISNLPHVTRVHVDQIKRNSTGSLTTLELVLEPAELGRISAKVSHENGRITLVLNAEHRHIADDLMRDKGLLLRVLGDHIPNIENVTIHVQSDAAQSSLGQGHAFGAMRSNQQFDKPKSRHGFEYEMTDMQLTNGANLDHSPATSSRVLL